MVRQFVLAGGRGTPPAWPELGGRRGTVALCILIFQSGAGSSGGLVLLEAGDDSGDEVVPAAELGAAIMPRSATCTASCPAARSRAATLGERLASTRSRTSQAGQASGSSCSWSASAANSSADRMS